MKEMLQRFNEGIRDVVSEVQGTTALLMHDISTYPLQVKVKRLKDRNNRLMGEVLRKYQEVSTPEEYEDFFLGYIHKRIEDRRIIETIKCRNEIQGILNKRNISTDTIVFQEKSPQDTPEQ